VRARRARAGFGRTQLAPVEIIDALAALSLTPVL
jgi:hypothetical protein